MGQKLIIRHLSGSKRNQTDEFLISDLKELSIGRDEGVDIRYDPKKDDLVSRRHAIIHSEDGNRFSIRDEESRNGTFVNKQRIFETTILSHGDIVQFGPGGPELRFELDPPPKATDPPTREVFTYLHSKSTSEVSSPGSPSGYRDAERYTGSNPKGRFTLLQDSFSAYKKKTLRTQISVGAGLLGLLILIGGLAYSVISKFERNTVDTITNIIRDHQTEMAVLETKVDEIAKETNLLMVPQIIGEKFSNAVVKIRLDWKLTHRETNHQVYHQRFGQGRFPAYLDINGIIIPWVTSNPENNTNIPVGGTTEGTGFSVSRNGLILTNRHIAAGATTSWGIQPHMLYKSYVYSVVEDSANNEKIVYKVSISNPKVVEGDRLNQLLRVVNDWVPAKEQILVEKRGRDNFIVLNTQNQFFSRDTLHVYFPGNPNPEPGRLIRNSNNHNVALIKVDSAGDFPEVELDKSNKEPVLGEAVTILGYPWVAEDITGLTKISNSFDNKPVSLMIYNPILSTGNMGRRINTGTEPADSSTQFWVSGDMYQLTANATGAGNSGGPVFNSQGLVTGIFFAGFESGGTRMNFAIPIKYGRELI